jgi:hypothetical protein
MVNGFIKEKMMSEHIRIDRETMIEHLVQSMLDDLEMNPDYQEVICRKGFMGYEEYTTEDLIWEYRDYISEDSNYEVNIELIEVKS